MLFENASAEEMRTKSERDGMGGALYVGPLAALALLLAVFCADAFHLELGVRAETGIEWADGTFAARQTVQARAPRTTGVLALQHTIS